MAQQHNPKIVTDGLIYHLDPTNGGKGASKIITKPTQVDDCVLWLDADDAETVVTSGTDIVNWLDKSGKGHHAEDHGATEYPQYDSSRINGRKVVNFVASSNSAGDVLKGRLAPTSISTSTLINTSPYAMNSISSASSTGVTGTSDGTGLRAVNTPDDVVFVSGKKYRVSYQCNLVSGGGLEFAIVDTQPAWNVTKSGFGSLMSSAGLNTRQWTCNESGTFVAVWYCNSASCSFVISDFEIVEVDDTPFSGSGTTVINVIKQNSFVGTEFTAFFENCQAAYASASLGNRIVHNIYGSAYSSGGSANLVRLAGGSGSTNWSARIENGAPVIGIYTNDSSNTRTYFNGKAIGSHSEDKGDDSRVYYCLGDDATSGDHYNGYICEVIIYNKVLSDAERQSIEYYLSRKWAVPLKGRVTTNLADGVNTTIINSSPVEVIHNNTFYFPNPDDDNCDIPLEGNEVTVADNLPWTIEFWVKRHVRGSVRSVYSGIWGNQLTTSEHERLQFSASSGADELILVDNGNNNSSTVITNIADLDCLHKWRHVVLAFDGTTDATTAGCLKQYVDGSDKGPAIALVNADSKITVRRIGSRGSTSDSDRLEGELGNFRVYNKQLSHAEVLQNYNAQRAKYENKKMSFAAPDNLLVYLDTQSGTSSNYYAEGTWYDISGGTAHNATRNQATWVDEGTKYYDFDGSDDYFTWGDITFLDGLTVVSASCWFRLDGDPPNSAGMLISKDNCLECVVKRSNSNEYSLSINNNHRVFSSAPTPAYNEWIHAVYTWNSTGDVRKLYLNGALVDTDTGGSQSGNALANSSEGLAVAARANGNYEINGQMSNVMIYNIELSADQVMQNHNYFKHRFGK